MTSRRFLTTAIVAAACGFLGICHGRVYGSDETVRMMLRSVQTAQSAAEEQRETSSGPESMWAPDGRDVEWQYLVIHHSGTESGSVEAIHAEHSRRLDAMGNPWLGIAYHFVIGNGHGMEDGHIAPTFRWREQLHGAHAGHAVYNARGIGICLIGDFEENRPTERQRDSLKLLIRELGARYRIDRDRLIGHSAIRATLCPGRNLPLEEFREELKQTGQPDPTAVRVNLWP